MAERFDRNNAFHDWLSASAYVRGADQTARVVSKKKHRSKRNSGIPDTENERLEAEQRIRVFWKLSNRHYRRWMNDRLLRELAPPLDAQEIGSLFAPPPWGEKSIASPFERVSAFGEGSAQDIAAWEPFRNNVDMDAEAKALQKERHRHGNVRMHNAASAAWQGVSHRSRDVLRRSSSWHLINLFEEKILNHLKEVERGGPTVLKMDVDDSYHRMLIHGICEFHGLSSKTICNTEEREGMETITMIIKVHVRRKKNALLKAGDGKDCHQGMHVSLMQFLTSANTRTSFTGSGA